MMERSRAILAARIRHQDIPLFGIASVDRWKDPPFDDWMPEQFYPQSIYPDCRSVVVIGYPITLPIIDTAPSIWYHEQYKTVNALLDQSAYRISLVLTELGHPSVYVPRDGYASLSALKDNPMAFFSHRHAAYLAGLGTFGWNNMLLTERFGPRVRFTSIFTTAELEPDPVMTDQLCIRCGRCVEQCPVHALQAKEYPSGLTDKEVCRQRNESLNIKGVSPCGICIKVCPAGRDRDVFDRKDMEVYERAEPPASWEHVRRYGVRTR
jgi:epoxyqueuosine reductase